MKEDVLEQIVDDYLQHLGYFTRHNIPFKPDSNHPEYVTNKDSVHSDVDVIGIHPMKDGVDRIRVVSCKSWQQGFDAIRLLRELNEGRDTWKAFRELWVPKWSEAFIRTVENLTGSREFTYHIAVTRLNSDGQSWEIDSHISQSLEGNPFRFLTLETMWKTIVAETKTNLASSEIGRLAQLLKAARLSDGSLLG